MLMGNTLVLVDSKLDSSKSKKVSSQIVLKLYTVIYFSNLYYSVKLVLKYVCYKTQLVTKIFNLCFYLYKTYNSL